MKLTALYIITFFISINISCKRSTRISENHKNSSNSIEKDHRKLAFQDDKHVSYYDFNIKKTTKLVEGFDPCISPDGKWIAYTEYLTIPDKDFYYYPRIIKLISTEDSIKKDLHIDNKNHYGPIWSPTGEYIVFSIMKNNWQIGIIKPNGSGLKILSINTDLALYGPTWTQDGKFVFVHDLETLYKFDLEGKIIKQYNLTQIFGDKYFLSSSTRFWLTSNTENLIFEAGIPEYIEGLKEPSNAIFCYNLKTKRVSRISKKGMYTNYFWIDNQDKIYFSSFKNINGPDKIYQANLFDTIVTELPVTGIQVSISK
ncbi:TolB family protein [Pedobacter xixiisoli]|uniref:WD40-like Beta Propeller Repeat n=1 Tax=Pedobacter xixiisoli TaxID=1476464 RepID=A0A285ZNP4_9SPHI|nr:PD40 domain-containing protein [Pedobacter xixiisoli]SOD11276.1 WD40-like Beta Propeller Repeat [Pedobacter xixiisoli]